MQNRRFFRKATAVSMLAAAACTGMLTAPAHADSGSTPESTKVATPSATLDQTTGPTVSPKIVGGNPTTNPTYVQLSFSENGSSGTYGCTGEAINSEWVLTARHCTENASSMNVYYSNSVNNPGRATAADRLVNSPYGDVGLVHLSTPRALSSYAKMASSYTPSSGQQASIYGYGLRANQQRPDQLYTATVNVLGTSRDAFNGPAIHVRGNSGASNHGDSGGPIVVNGQIVGVCSTGDSADPGADTHAGSNYANLTSHRSWIQQQTGA